jgi:Family of unknown function (DUF6134)
MKTAVGMFSVIITATCGMLVTLITSTGAAAQSVETMRFAIMRNGEQIGTHAIEISRKGAETDVRITTDLAVKVLFVTAYQLQHSATERWMNGQLVSLDSTTDNNGVRHTVAVTRDPSGLAVEADGKTSHVDQNVFPASLWNSELIRRKVVLDTQDGQVDPITITDDGPEDLRFGTRAAKAHHYEMKGRYTQHIWYDEGGRLVQVKLVGSDGSEISYKPI